MLHRGLREHVIDVQCLGSHLSPCTRKNSETRDIKNTRDTLNHLGDGGQTLLRTSGHKPLNSRSFPSRPYAPQTAITTLVRDLADLTQSVLTGAQC